MDKKILFLMRNDKLTLRRYLYVLRSVERSKYQSSFLSLSTNKNILSDTLNEIFGKETIREIHEITGSLPFYYRAFSIIKRSFDRIFKVKRNDDEAYSFYSDMDDLAKDLLKIFPEGYKGINSGKLLDYFFRRKKNLWYAHVSWAKRKIRQIDPSCIVYDLEIDMPVRAFLYAARSARVPVLSMQHAEGFCEQYSRFPDLADHYIAYGSYNGEKIRSMGVAGSRIHVTGSPDTDRLLEKDIHAVKEEMGNEYSIDFNKKIILAALRPSNSKDFDEKNRILIDSLDQAFRGNGDFQVLVKPHNVDYVRGRSLLVNVDNKDNIKILNSDADISKILKVCNCLITYMSSCIVDALLLKLPVAVIQTDDAIMWPPWDEYGLFKIMDISNIADMLKDIMDNNMPFINDTDKWKEFVKRFRYRYDAEASSRIASVIDEIIR